MDSKATNIAVWKDAIKKFLYDFVLILFASNLNVNQIFQYILFVQLHLFAEFFKMQFCMLEISLVFVKNDNF